MHQYYDRHVIGIGCWGEIIYFDRVFHFTPIVKIKHLLAGGRSIDLS
jgi:hypothetical protein